MSESAASGYGALSSGSEVIDLKVLCLNGEGCTLKVGGSHMGLDVCRMVQKTFFQQGKVAD